jgi:hypothetical protein
MSEPPPRLHTDPESELERALLGAGRSYRASQGARNKVLAGMGLAAAAVSTNAAASALGKLGKLGKLGTAKWVVAAVVVAGAAVPTVRYLNAHHRLPVTVVGAPASTEPSAVAPPSLAVAPPSLAVAPPSLAVAPPSLAVAPPSLAVAPPSLAVAAPAPPGMGPDTAVAPSAAPGAAALAPRSEPKSAPLSAELSALDAARSSLVSGDPSAALSALDGYARKFPHGRLSLEAEVLRIDALAKSGQTAAARQRASAFIRRHPNSVLATRVRAFAGQ